METTSTPTKINRFAGSCGRCGAKVPAETGLYVVENLGDGLIHRGAVHTDEAACKTTTKTWRQFTSRRRHVEYLAALDATWTDHGMTRPRSTHVDAPAYGGGSGRQVVITPAHHVKVNGVDVGAIPARPETGDYHADGIAQQRLIVAMVLPWH